MKLFSFLFFKLLFIGVLYSQAKRPANLTVPKAVYELKTYINNQISESSGLIFTDGKLWTHNDSGGQPALFSIDTISGLVKQTVIIDNFPNIDWEDITADSNYLFIGDFGNNSGTRRDLKVLKIPKVLIGDTPLVHIKAQAIQFSYSDQMDFTANPQTNFDCEAFLAKDSSLFLFSKNKGDGYSRVYQLPKNPGTYTINPFGSFNVKGKICGAAYNPLTKTVALIGYEDSDIRSFVWLFNNYNDSDFFLGSKKRILIGSNLVKWKTEAITFRSRSRVFFSCEKSPKKLAAIFTMNN